MCIEPKEDPFSRINRGGQILGSGYARGIGQPAETAQASAISRDVPEGERLLRDLVRRRAHHEHELEKVSRALKMAADNPQLIDAVEFQSLINSIRG